MATTRIVAAAALISVACASRARAPEVDNRLPAPVATATPSPVEVPASALPAIVLEEKMPSEPFTLRDDRERAIEVYPPLSREPRAPIVVFLHATCMQPAAVCNGFGNAARDQSWLICPSGNSTCYGEPDWHGPGREKAAFLASALAKVDGEIATFVAERPGVLIGWSRGAFAARDILDASLSDPKSASLTGRFRGLVLLAAHVKPELAKLKKAGITRVVMAAGDYDGARPTMMSAIESLRASGFEARYVSLGKIAHVWPSDFDARMREPIAWASGAP